jgi:hypothetical protein
MRKPLGITAMVVIALVAFVPAASSNPFVPPMPKKGHASFKWLSYGCKDNRAYASIRTGVHKLKSKYGQFFQKVKVQIDRSAGYNSHIKWSEVDSNVTKGRKFQKGKQATQLGIGLPNFTVAGVRTGMQPNQGQLSAKATIWLKADGLLGLRSTWRYKVRSPTFTCADESSGGFLPPPGGAPPSTGGGGP